MSPSQQLSAPVPAQGNGRRLVDRLPAILDEVTDIVNEGAVSGRHTNGARVVELEGRLAQWLGAADVVGVASGSAALRGVFELLRLPPGSEVIVPAYTFVMSAYAVSDAFAVDPRTGAFAKAGLVPVFVDVDPHTYTVDAAQVRAAITDRTRAIMAVHLCGQMADMAPLLELAGEHDLVVVEDAAQAHGATYVDPATGATQIAGSAGHFACFSLSDVKNLGTLGGDAGALVVSPRGAERFPDAAARARAWRDTGRCGVHRYRHQSWGVRARMDEYGAAECAAELQLLDAWNDRRRAIAARYDMALAAGPVAAPSVAPHRSHVYFNYMAKARDSDAREELIAHMRAAGIATADAYTVVADQEVYTEGRLPSRCAGSLDVARGLERSLVPVPCYPELTEAEIARVEAALATCSKHIAPAQRFVRAGRHVHARPHDAVHG